MTNRRYKDLMQNDQLSLTPEEIAEGWHWCDEFDGLLVGPGMDSELECCQCVLPTDKGAKNIAPKS